ncbi:brf RNA polymerase III subunit isoform X1 [Bombus vancouverensis nearcticus]|uniref:B-related factor 1 n=1 Tax=Bombus bifarius TaxID=103933 RepID=A0A6P8N226_9HYME|nr:transcription factor IIIB 90 kDa subunit isoform X1 [Bombus vancouverensis nearcticus]XP_033190538.1 transcription factor IIIB 90 kDa subunit isoform X1 [Bombus vancouverensis nearcticus]XP_033190539.1 transcription factor IIIB 90 kDa subunit isoform X1 [Bombus vancouverensis nearcticus]XP_033308720.1 transcription factor IIIB 90 kDa subunit isoform X1 [Bombus bifarius]XP_033308721.1 transcription factor IIIB 90 kDa subunit isoform X1 [Bombus bifarius]
MSASKCRNCGSTNIETDPARGDAVCTDCGFVLEDQLIVSETAFKETPSGNMMVLGQFVANDSTGGATGFGATYHVNGKESRGITLQNARKGITHLCMQLQLNQHCIDTSMNFYKMALNRQLTRGRKQAHNHAACVYITCRTEGTAHMLIDISDVLQICVHELGRTYLRFTQALCINIPSVDPCLYIMRFANKLEFGEKTHEVSMTALRVVQRMKRDSIHSGRRPSGLCGAALLMAARLHEFNRSPADIIKIVKVHESTLRKRLIEFGDTPSSALTLEEFMTVDLEEEQDPPAFKAARKKDRERLQRLNIDTEINELQAEIDKQLEEHRLGKMKKRKDAASIERADTDRFIRESNLDVIKHYVGNDVDDPDSDFQDSEMNNINDRLITGLGPNIASMGLISINDRENETKESVNTNFENDTGEIDVADLDDEELDSYIMSEKEAQFKHNLWNKVNAEYLNQQKEKEERRQKEKEEGKPEKKRRRTTKRNKNQVPANTAGEAIEKMLQEKKISSKINYEVLKSLNVSLNNSTKEQQKVEEPVQSPKKEMNTSSSSNKISNISNSSRIKDKPITPVVKKPRVDKPQIQKTKKEVQMPVEIETNTTESILPKMDTSCDMDETDDYVDEDVEADPTEMTVGEMLGHHGSEDENDFGYGYDEEDY